jgi:hypothetical protein
MANKSFTVYKGHQVTKTFYINQTINGVTTPYDMTALTIVLDVYDRQPIPVLLYSLSPFNRGLGFCTFVFSAAQTNLPEPHDSFIIEDKVGINQILSYGTISPVDIHNYIPFADILAAESVEGLVIPDTFSSVKSYEWRLFLQNALVQPIADADVNNETAWPPLANFLIAKLVVHSFIMNLIRNAQGSSLSASFEGVAPNVKKIETGPANAEFHDTSRSLSDMLKPNAQGKSGFDILKSELCTLAGKLRVSIPDICGLLPESPIIPIKVERPETLSLIDQLTAEFPE